MEKYKNISNQENTFFYEIGANHITLLFKGKSVDTGEKYHYTINSMLRININKMQELAWKGQGLRTYINKNWRSKVVNHENKEIIDIDWENFE